MNTPEPPHPDRIASPQDDGADRSESFVRLLTENQNRLYGYVYSLLGDSSRAADVVQETNLVLWRKIGEFNPELPFLPWAFAIARFQVLAHYRDRGRDRMLLDPELVEILAVDAAEMASQTDDVRDALRGCIGELTPGNREMLERRYYHSASIDEVAQALNRSVSAVKVALMRVRRRLARCVENQMMSEVAP